MVNGINDLDKSNEEYEEPTQSNTYSEIPIDDSDFIPANKRKLTGDLNGKDAVIREIAKRTRYPIKSIKVMYDALADIFEDAVLQEKNIMMPDILSLIHSTMKPYNGVNPYKTRMTGKIVREDFPESKRIILRLGQTLRKLAKKEYDKNRNKESSDE